MGHNSVVDCKVWDYFLTFLCHLVSLWVLLKTSVPSPCMFWGMSLSFSVIPTCRCQKKQDRKLVGLISSYFKWFVHFKISILTNDTFTKTRCNSCQKPRAQIGPYAVCHSHNSTQVLPQGHLNILNILEFLQNRVQVWNALFLALIIRKRFNSILSFQQSFY